MNLGRLNRYVAAARMRPFTQQPHHKNTMVALFG